MIRHGTTVRKMIGGQPEHTGTDQSSLPEVPAVKGGTAYISNERSPPVHRWRAFLFLSRSVTAAPSLSSSSVCLQPWMQEVLSFLLLAVLTPPLRRSVSILVPEHTALLLTRTQSEH